MASNVKAVPDGYHSVIPYIIVNDGAAAIDFYTRVFGATERMRMPGPDGKIGHGELEIGDSVIAGGVRGILQETTQRRVRTWRSRWMRAMLPPISS
ncbi:MAG: hypothetical protein EXR43_03535 [Dehalococcoidia bacterium]|nr:hypothetical protein [Dehalococcoidia bacterium]